MVLHKNDTTQNDAGEDVKNGLAVGKTFNFRSGDGYTVQGNGSVRRATPKHRQTREEVRRDLLRRAKHLQKNLPFPIANCGDWSNERNSMHYKNGRLAKVGDQVVNKDNQGKASGGILVEASPGCTTCNGKILPNQGIWNLPSVNLSDCLHVEDAFPVPAPVTEPEPAPAPGVDAAEPTATT
ncbi:MAG: hypothetical protein JWR19_2197 [Pedosphaera sp.]|nr:hypothetical protein [Pedosphaera sp.]